MLTTVCYLNVYVCTEMKITLSFKQTVWGQGVNFFSTHLPVHNSSPGDVLLYDVYMFVSQSL